MINRAVLIVRPQKPFLDWAAQLDDSGLLPNVEGEQTAYLLPDYDDERGSQAILKKVYATIFENELFGWHTDESAWPVRRDFKTFCEWFSIELHSVVEDLCDYEITEESDD